MDALIQQLKSQIITELKLENITPDDIKPEAPLLGEELGLDSIDVLSLIVLVEKNYGLKVASAEEGKAVFQTLQTLAEYIHKNKN